MTNNEPQDVDLENNEEATESVETTETAEEVEKPTTEQLEAEIAKWKRIAERNKKEKKELKEELSEAGDFNRGDKAYMMGHDLRIKSPDEIEFTQNWMKRTGEDLEAVLEDDIFQAKIGKMREAKKAAEAIPKGTNRSQQQSADDVGYWQRKIESGSATIADIPDITVRRKVLNARIETERVGNRFSDQAVQM